MEPHIADTIADIDRQIIALTNIKDQLRDLFGCRPEPVATHPIERQRTQETPSARKPKAKAPRRSEASEHNAACCLKLSQPFARQALAKATGLSNNGATSQIGRWVARGLVKRVGSNQYERTAKFPQKTSIKPAAAERVHVPGLDPDPKGSIEDQLARSLKTC